MTGKERKALLHYMRWVANHIELRDWTISLDHEPCEEHLSGSANCTPGQKHITIAVAATFLEYTPEEQRDTIVHELVHAHMEVCWRMVQSDLEDPLGKLVYYVFCDSYRRGMEYAVDGITKALTPHLPLIEWPKPSGKRS